MNVPRSPSSIQVLEDATTNVEKRIEEFDSWYRNRKKPTPSTTPVKQVHFQSPSVPRKSAVGGEKEGTGSSSEMGREARTPLQNKSNNWQPPSRTKAKQANREANTGTLPRNVAATSASNRSCTGNNALQSVDPTTTKSPALIDLATPMQQQAHAQAQQTPAWAKEVSHDMMAQPRQHQHRAREESTQHSSQQMPMSPATAKRSSLMNDVMLLLDEKTQECRKLYTLVKQLDAQTSPSVETANTNLHGTHHSQPQLGSLSPGLTLAGDWEDNRDKQAVQRYRLNASKSAGTQTGGNNPKLSSSSSSSATQVQKDLVCKLEKLLHEAKVNSSQQGQVEENQNQPQKFGCFPTDTIDQLQSEEANSLDILTSENTELRRLNQELQVKVRELEAENSKLKKDQRDCLEAVNKADQLILKVLSQQQKV